MSVVDLSSKKYISSSSEMIHIDMKNNQCEVCDISFNDIQILKTHLKIHTGQKHKCRTCEKQYATPGSLRTHEVIHQDERKFKCEFCGKTCKRKNDLKIHERIHTSEKQ